MGLYAQAGGVRRRARLNGFAGAGSDRLAQGEALYAGQSIVSSNGRFSFTLNPDGNLVLVDGAFPGGKLLWTSGTNAPGATFVFSGDLRLWLYYGTEAAWPVWQAIGYEVSSPDEWGDGSDMLVMQDDGNLTTNRGWSTGTWGAQVNPIAQQPVPTIDPTTGQPSAQVAAMIPGQEIPSPSPDVLAAIGQGSGVYKLADEGSPFTISEASDVAYGAGSRFIFRRLPAGSYSCSNSFWSVDPANGTRKACYLTSFRETPAAPSPAEAQIAYVIRRWAGHKLWEIPVEDRARLARISDLSHESGAQFPRGAPISPVFLRVHPDQIPDTSLIRRDDGERAHDAQYDHDLWFSPIAQDWYVIPVRTIYQQDWGTFGIEGFHIENNVSAIATIVGSVVGTVVPGIGTAVGAALIAAGKIVQPMIATHEKAQTGKAAQGVIVGTVPDLMKFKAEDLLYTEGGVPIGPDGEPIHPSQIETPGSNDNLFLYGGLGVILLAAFLSKK